MNILDIFSNISELHDDMIISFTTGDMKNFPYPSIVVFKGESTKYGKGYAICVDFSKGIEIWSDKTLHNDIVNDYSLDLMEYTKVYYNALEINLSHNWEEFYTFSIDFIKENNFIVIYEMFEKYEFVNEKNLNLLENIVKKIEIIRDNLHNFILKDDLMFKMEIKNSGKSLLFNLDVSKYTDLVSRFDSEFDKRAILLIMRIALEDALFANFDSKNISIISNGMCEVDIIDYPDLILKEKLLNINKKLHLTENDIYRIYFEITDIKEIIQEILSQENKLKIHDEIDGMELIDMLVLDHVKRKNNSIMTKLQNLSSSILKKTN